MHYPWTKTLWHQLTQRREQQRLPHALMLTGSAGLGKTEFAQDLAQSLLCEQPAANSQACGQCRACTRFLAGTHPDFLQVEPEEPGKAIKVDQIRQLINEFSLASHQGGYRIAIIEPADSMNLAASNSLLKTLEEPPGNSLILLVSSNPSLLPATILSRCQRLNFTPPSHSVALEWLINNHDIPADKAEALLALANDAPLTAVGLADDSLLSERQALFEQFSAIAMGQSALSQLGPWLKLALPTPINWLSSWINDLIRLKSGLPQALRNRDFAEGLQNLAQRVDLPGLFVMLDELNELLRMQRTPLNTQLLMEDTLLKWQSLSSGKNNRLIQE